MKVVALVFDSQRQLKQEIPFRSVNEKTFTAFIPPGYHTIMSTSDPPECTLSTAFNIPELVSSIAICAYSANGFSGIESMRVHCSSSEGFVI